MLAVDDMAADTRGRSYPWAANGKAVRIGQIVLLVDSDTVVPEVRACRVSLPLHVLTPPTAVGLPPRRRTRDGRQSDRGHHPARLGHHAGRPSLL